MSFGELSTPELRRAAEQEAGALHINPAALEGRDRLRDFVIEDADIGCRQNSVGITAYPDGHRVLRVSVTDLEPFLVKDSAIATYALRKGYSTYDKHGRLRAPMLPTVLSEDRLSLVHGVERPVVSFHLPVDPAGKRGELTISRDVLIAQALTLDEAEAQRTAEHGDGPLPQLETVARNLYAARHAGVEIDEIIAPRDEDGNVIDTDYPIELLIIYESLYAVRAAAGTYLRQHRAPTIYRNYKPDAEDEFWARNDPEVARLLAKGSFSAIPQGHLGLRFSEDQPYAPVTSPLESYADLVNLCNLTALIGGRGYPFGQRRIGYAVERLNYLEQDMRQKAARAAKKEQRRSSQPAAKSRPADYFRGKLADGSAHAGDMTHALFGTVLGGNAEIQHLRHAVVEHVAQNIQFPRQIIQIAAARGWLGLRREAPPEGQAEAAGLIVVDASGNEYSYSTSGSQTAIALGAARLLGKMVGHTVAPGLPEKLTKAYRIAHDPFEYLRSLSEQHDLRIGYVVHETDDPNTVTITMGITVGDIRHAWPVTAGDIEQARREGAMLLINEFGLDKKRLPEPRDRELREEEIQNPITSLNNLVVRLNAPTPQYTFTTAKKGKTTCTVAFADAKGEPHTRTATHASPKTAQKEAALQALACLPYVPPSAKRQRKRVRYKSNVRSRAGGNAEPMET